ncbi:MAG: PadR family transcriptional regulator [Ktedonobacterales bacterium]
MVLRELELGAIQAHILYHAVQAPFYGTWIVDELAHHGYTVSYGTLYPTLHRMEQAGLLVHEDRREGRTMRKYYRATPRGLEALDQAKQIIRALYQELIVEGSDDEATP